MRKDQRAEARKAAERLALEKKSARTGIPVAQLKKKKHAAKLKKGKRH